MKTLFTVFFSFLFLHSPWLASVTNEKPRICYFQLTTSNEAGDLKGRISEINASEKVEVENYDIGAKHPTTAFKDMIKDNQKCDALVISGHHAGDFASKEKGTLPLDFIEKLACNPNYEKWFKNVKALYLHGCNTLKDSYLKRIREGSDPDKGQTGDKLSLREVEVLGKLNLTWEDAKSAYVTNYSYANTLDEHTPLSSRYMRAFPNTSIYGFRSKGGTGAGGGDIFKHILKVAKALRSDPPEQTLATDEFLKGLGTITADECADDSDNDKWPSAVIRNEYQLPARRLGCNLINNKKVLDDENSSSEEKEKAKEEIKKALKEIAKDKELSHLLINNIYETVKLADKLAAAEDDSKDTDFLKQIQSILTSNPFQSTLEDKMNSPILPSLRKADYIKLYQRMGGDKGAVRKATENLITNVILKKDQSDNQKVLGILIADKLSQYKLLSSDQISRIENNPELFPPPDKNPTDWQNAIKWKLGYRGYTVAEGDSKTGHSFIKSLGSNAKNPNYVRSVTMEILKHNDLNSAFQMAAAIAPESTSDGSINDKNTAFIRSLKAHIQYAPKGLSRLEMVKGYFTQSHYLSGETKGKERFQANLLTALWNLPDEEFKENPEAYGGAKSKKEFFNQLSSVSMNSSSNSDTLQAIIYHLNQ